MANIESEIIKIKDIQAFFGGPTIARSSPIIVWVNEINFMEYEMPESC